MKKALIPMAIKEIADLDEMMERLQSRADEITSTIRFLASVRLNNHYDKIKSAFDRDQKDYYDIFEFMEYVRGIRI